MQFYDLPLNNGVWCARHAMSIDENRADFARVQWGGVHNRGPARPDEYPDWLQQVWFLAAASMVRRQITATWVVATRKTRYASRIFRSDG